MTVGNPEIVWKNDGQFLVTIEEDIVAFTDNHIDIISSDRSDARRSAVLTEHDDTVTHVK